METYNPAVMGERIQRARMARGWKQKDLAERTGVPQGNISRIERGRMHDMALSRFVTILRVLEVSAEALLAPEPDVPAPRPRKRPRTQQPVG